MRKEKDSMGSVKVPSGALYGAFTQRALENFRITGQKTDPFLIKNIAAIKLACAKANSELGFLDKRKTKAITKASEEIIKGKFSDQFPLDPIQAGAGTPVHMNVNEVIANRANQILGGKPGEYKFIHPNDHVNMAQSSNCVVPSAIRITCLEKSLPLLRGMKQLAKLFRSLSRKHSGVVKVGRTHLQDAVPITYGQVFNSYEITIQKSLKQLKQTLSGLREINLGGSAIGTGMNTHPEFGNLSVKQLNKFLKQSLFQTKEPIQQTSSVQDFHLLSASLNSFCIEMLKIIDDLILLSSGPRAGIGEITLPEVEPGSSIMPGKVNPSILEAFRMVCLDARGKNETVSLASAGELELNTNTPVISMNLFRMMDNLSSGISMLSKHLPGLEVNKERVKENLENSTSIATALSPRLGYNRTAEIVKKYLKSGKSVRELAKLDRELKPEKLTGPNRKSPKGKK